VSPVRRLDDLEATPDTAIPVYVRINTPPPGTSFNYGDLVAISAVFSDPSSTVLPVDFNGFSIVTPSAPTCTVKLPNGDEQVPDLVNAGGLWTAKLPVTTPGVYWFRVETEGTYQGVAESFFQVRRRLS
jgi:hypothetical protein